MKKIEILKLIEANKVIKKNQKLLSITKDKRFNTKLTEENWFPHIEDLKEEFAILKKEVELVLDETRTSEKYIQNSNCNHAIRLKRYNLFTSNYKCIFCDKNIVSDNCVNWEYSINRNKYCVNLVAKYQEDEECGYIKDGYTKEQIYEIITNILKEKNDDEEIDLIQEFKKLNLPKCEINEEHKVNEKYILIVGGTNKQFIDEESYLYKKTPKTGLDFMIYFSEFLNTKVELVDTEDNIDIKDLYKNNYNLKFTNYNTIEELEKKISEQSNIPFNIIIDLTELYQYKISDITISKETYNLNLQKQFPNSHIIRINNLSNKQLDYINKYLKTMLETTHTYAYKDNKYYYLEDGEIKSNNLDTTCNKIKKLLKK